MTGPRTVEELRAALTTAGRFADGIGRWGEPGLRTDEGCSAVRTRPDGTVELVTFGRGTNRVEVFGSEAEAITELARVLLAPAPIEARTAEQRAADRARMQEVARRALADLERSHDTDD